MILIISYNNILYSCTSFFFRRIWFSGFLTVAVVVFLTTTSVAVDTSFLRELPYKGIATYEDGCRAMAVLMKMELPDDSFGNVVKALQEKGVVSERWKAEADAPFTWGRVSYMLCKVLGINGGLTMRIFGVSERYAYRECVSKGLMPPGHKVRFLTGADLIAIMYKAETYIKER